MDGQESNNNTEVPDNQDREPVSSVTFLLVNYLYFYRWKCVID